METKVGRLPKISLRAQIRAMADPVKKIMILENKEMQMVIHPETLLKISPTNLAKMKLTLTRMV
jgi:hypothetical protein